MPRVPVHTVDTAPEAAQDNLRALTERVGKTLNIFGEMAHAPIVLESSRSSAPSSRTTSTISSAPSWISPPRPT